MLLTDILDPQAVRLVHQISSKKRLMRELAELAEQVYGLPADEAVDALLDRETLGPTGVGHGVALPHARLSSAERVVGAFIRLDKPLDFSSVDRQPVDLVFCLFAPLDGGVDHLKALALVSRTLRDGATCAKLRANDDAATLHAILTEGQRIQAA